MKKLLLLAALSLLAACVQQPTSTRAAARVGILKVTPSDIDGITDWEKKNGHRTTGPDTTVTYLTKFGETVKWESWGPWDAKLKDPSNFQSRNKKRFARFPRVYLCTIDNPTPGRQAVFDLYDLGLQRTTKPMDIYLWSGGPALIYERDLSGNETLKYTLTNKLDTANIRAGDYNSDPYDDSHPDAGDLVKQGMTLRFSSNRIQFVIYRAGPGMPGESGGSPPPPDPGDDSSDLP